MPYLRFRRWLDEMRAACGIAEVVYEEVELGLGTIAVAAAIVAMVRRERNGNGHDCG